MIKAPLHAEGHGLGDALIGCAFVVDRAGRGVGEIAIIGFLIAPVRDVGVLLRKFGLKGVGWTRQIIGSEQPQIFAPRKELEVGVQLGRGVGPAVFARGEHHQIAVGGQGAGRKAPFVGMVRVIGQGPTGQVDGDIARIVELDPVGRVAIFILQAEFVGRQEFVDDGAACGVARRAKGGRWAGENAGGASAQEQNARGDDP